MGFTKTFRRVEVKYLLTESQTQKFLKRIEPYVEKDLYFHTTINNVYYDTPSNDLIIKSINKPMFKEKLRIRSYGTPNLNNQIFVEIKHKYKGVVGKRRVSMSLKEFYDFVSTRSYDESNQIMKEIAYLFQHYKLVPKCFIAYDRNSYRGILDSSLRITIDTNLRSRRYDLKMELGDYGTSFFDTPHSIVEVKVLGAVPLWLSRIFTELQVYPRGFSKYGNIYKKESGLNVN